MAMEIDDLGLSPSFSCYFSDSLTTTTTTAMAAAKVSREFVLEQQSAKLHEFIDVDEEEEDDFEFSQVLENDDEEEEEEEEEQQVFSGKRISVHRLPPAAGVDFPVGELDTVSKVNIQIRKLFVNGGGTSSFPNLSSSSSSESEIESSDGGPSGSFCMWRPRSDVVSPILTKCKESGGSSAAGSGSRRRWRRILDLIRRSNAGGSILFSRSNRKIKASKQNRKVTPVEVAGKLKSSAGSSPSFHELFYARKRAEKEGDRMKSFLPYRQDLLGFFVNINRIGSKKSTTF